MSDKHNLTSHDLVTHLQKPTSAATTRTAASMDTVMWACAVARKAGQESAARRRPVVSYRAPPEGDVLTTHACVTLAGMADFVDLVRTFWGQLFRKISSKQHVD